MTRTACPLGWRNIFIGVYLSALGLTQLQLFVIHGLIFPQARQASAVCYSMVRVVRLVNCSCLRVQSTSYLYLWFHHDRALGASTLCSCLSG